MSKQLKPHPISTKKSRCLLCKSGINYIDHKDIKFLQKFITDNGKIKPRRASNLCAKHQRMVSNAIKNARLVGLLEFVKEV